MNELTIEQIASAILFNNQNIIGDMLSLLLNEPQPMMVGGKGQQPNEHEKTFHQMFPDLESQVSFGTGMGGLKKYGAKCYTVDFLDRERNLAIEIDGSSHNSLRRKVRDLSKEIFLLEVHGISTIRFTNEQVREKLIKRLRELESEGRLKWETN